MESENTESGDRLLPSRAARAKELEEALAPPRRPPATPQAEAEPAPKKPKRPVTEVTSNGTETVVYANGTNMTGRGGMFMEPTSPLAIMNNMLLRSQLDPSTPPLEPLSPTITGLQQAVKAMSRGEDIAPYKAHIQQVAANQPEKGDVVRSFVNQANQEIIADLIEMRADTVRRIKRATRQDDVSVSESIVVWKMCTDQLPALTKGITEDGKAVDTVTVVEKIDFQRQQAERSVARHWEGTTPQGREIIRKNLWKLKRELQAQMGILPLGLEPPQPPVDEEQEEIPTANA